MLLIAFGGPQGRDDIRPFLANVLRGRRVSPERIETVAHHYGIFGGISPITELTLQQADRLMAALAARGLDLPVYVGMRNWTPYLGETLARMSRDGVRRAVGVIAAAHRSYSSCTQYRENIASARQGLRGAGLHDVAVTHAGDWHLSDGFIQANVEHLEAALESLPAEVRSRAEIVFTAHSIPVAMADRYPYVRQIEASAAAVIQVLSQHRAQAAGSQPGVEPVVWHLVYQSRSGRPEDPWLGPDVCDHLRASAARQAPAVVLCPIGFVCDHIEVLYDLDVEAAAVAHELRLPLARASAVNIHPRFIEALADAVVHTLNIYRRGTPLPIV